ncbi:hypothetical protein Mapa_013253 [Marchantia paleacea]|nr:hypothetical protein Mapa_013253 [Marchantia paleacea]
MRFIRLFFPCVSHSLLDVQVTRFKSSFDVRQHWDKEMYEFARAEMKTSIQLHKSLRVIKSKKNSLILPDVHFADQDENPKRDEHELRPFSPRCDRRMDIDTINGFLKPSVNIRGAQQRLLVQLRDWS